MARRYGKRRPARRRTARRNGGDRAAWLLGGLLAVFLVGMAAFWWNAPAAADLDEATLCPTDPALVPRVHAVLLERNRRVWADTGEFSPMDPNTARQVRRLLVEELQALPPFAKVVVHEVAYDERREFEPLIEKCNPGDGSTASRLYENPGLARQRYRDAFAEPLRALLEERSGWSPDRSHSLLHSLDGVARMVFGDPRYARAARSLTVVSDFVVPQNFGLTSWFGIHPGAARVEAPPPPGPGAAGFDGAEVGLIYARIRYRSIPDIQDAEHLAWWNRYFGERGATVTEVRHVGADR